MTSWSTTTPSIDLNHLRTRMPCFCQNHSTDWSCKFYGTFRRSRFPRIYHCIINCQIVNRWLNLEPFCFYPPPDFIRIHADCFFPLTPPLERSQGAAQIHHHCNFSSQHIFLFISFILFVTVAVPCSVNRPSKIFSRKKIQNNTKSN